MQLKTDKDKAEAETKAKKDLANVEALRKSEMEKAALLAADAAAKQAAADALKKAAEQL